MIVPETGRVLVFDDEPKEAAPLLRMLSRHRVPYLFYSNVAGQDLPTDAPIPGVRLVFLDLQLGAAAINDDAIISGIGVRLSRTIEKGEPYALVYWSTKESKYRGVLEEAFKGRLRDYCPIAMMSLPKADIIEKDRDFDYISGKLEDELAKVGAFQILMLWENIVAQSSAAAVSEFSRLLPRDDNWKRKLDYLVASLAAAFAGKHSSTSGYGPPERARDAMFTLNQSLLDYVERIMVARLDASDAKKFLSDDVIQDASIIQLLNSKLFLAESYSDATKPGGLFLLEEEVERMKSGRQKRFDDFMTERVPRIPQHDAEGAIAKQRRSLESDLADIEVCRRAHGKLHNVILNDCLQDSAREQFSDCRAKSLLVEVNVTPVCDYAQKKHPKSRFLPGLLFPLNLVATLTTADYLYKASAPMLVDGKPYILILDYRYLHSVTTDELSKRNARFSIRQQLLVDIQAKLSTHINRPGVLFIPS